MIIIFLCLLLLLFLSLILFKNKNKQNFYINNCLGKRDGVSGCRDCCAKQKQNYSECVSNCMNY
jgi:hypothetical protein